VSLRAQPDPALDLTHCADEPIRVPGAIQPHGRMLVVDAAGRLLAYSDNWLAGGRPPLQAVPAEIAALLVPVLTPPAPGPDPADAPAPAAGDGLSPRRLGGLRLDGQAFDLLIHRRDGLLLAELETAPDASIEDAPIYAVARRFLPELQHADTVRQALELAVAELQRLTGFGRCLAYCFDAEGHGHVLAERCQPGYAAYLGHRFPASDIPAQARELYRLNHVRLIADAGYTPVPLRGVDPQWAPQSLDLSLSALRSVSPVHLEYMRNMGTLASMSVSLVVDGRLWGLISCHHHEPRHVPFVARAACEHLARLVSMQIAARESNHEVARRLELRQLTLDIVAQMADSDATLQQLTAAAGPLLRMAGATGAAMVLDDDCWTVGDTPAPDDVQQLARWVAHRGGEVVHTDRLGEAAPGIAPAAVSQGCTGLLAISISQVHRHLVMWFRPEIVQTLKWAGDPRKPVSEQDGRLHPRRSFDTWREEVRGRSEPWTAAELGAARELRQALIGIVLRRAEEMAEVATELGRVNKELEAFSYTVSHDLRAPMRHIAGYADLLLEADGAHIGERGRRYLAHVKEAAAYAGQLVDALLDFSRMGRSALKRSDVDCGLLVEALVAELTQQEPSRVVQWQVDADLPRLYADPFLLQVAVRNLLGNALKYTRGREPARITVQAVRRAEGCGLEVADNGVGFNMKYVAKLFGVFQRLHAAEEFEGTGIGLANVRRIVERHGGTVWAEGTPGQGARFGFVLPEKGEVH
jgi:light-regulated signal transduction histidine kinase (bacteriophytochrome)